MTNTNAANAPYSILDLAAHRALTELQETAKVILGDTEEYNKVIRSLNSIEDRIMTPGATEAIEGRSAHLRLVDPLDDELFSPPNPSPFWNLTPEELDDLNGSQL